MPTYWLSYRIADHDEAAATYDTRYDAFHVAFYGLVEDDIYWNETTSFFVFNSIFSTREIANILKLPLMVDFDVFLLRKMDSKSAVIFGASHDRSIFQLMPYLVRIS